LQAAFLADERGRQAWQSWRAAVDLENHLPAGVYRLFPQILQNLRRLGVEDSFSKKMAGSLRQNWLRNQVLWQSIKPVVQQCDQAGIQLMPVKRLALTLNMPQDLAPPLDGELNFFVHPEDVPAALQTFQLQGWTCRETDLNAPIQIQRGHLRLEKDGVLPVALLWRIPGILCASALLDSYWEHTWINTQAELPVAHLHPTFLLLSLCLQAEPGAAFERAVDVLLITEGCREQISWRELFHHARRYNQVEPARQTLLPLADFLPAEARKDLLRLRKSTWEVVERAWRRKPDPRWGRLPERWFSYRCAHARESLGSQLFGFGVVLADAWGLTSPYLLPLEATRRAWRRLRLHP
jgi:hypothetical protein